MNTLIVENFSCITHAKVSFDKLTVFIGPQASGKSVICKLHYFLIEAASLQGQAVLRKASYEKFCEDLKRRFVEWFPPSAWGNGKFKISLTSGEFSVSLVRKTYAQTNSDDFRLKFSAEFRQQYEQLLRDTQKIDIGKRSDTLPDEIHMEWRVQEASTESLRKLMGTDFTASQTFVPAGRSFFTSIGKAIAVFEQGRALDPLILRFGRIYTASKGRAYYFKEPKNDTQFRDQFKKSLDAILGGVLRQDGDQEYVVTSDGRKVPLTALSSGQQELLPLISVLPNLVGPRAVRCYIEEPEAHLFPSAQSKLIESFVTLLNASSQGLNLVLTTHSPYVLAKINNLIKAGELGRRRSPTFRKKVDAVVPTSSWLNGKEVRAYAIRDGVVESIMDSDNLIDADYLDSVSSDIAQEFGALLEVEVTNA